LPKIAAQLYDGYTAVDRRNLAQQMEGQIGASIVHENQFKAVGIGLHHPFQAVVENGHVLLFIVKRDNDGVLGHGDEIITGRVTVYIAFEAIAKLKLSLETLGSLAPRASNTERMEETKGRKLLQSD
jgi:hypothetical protein